ncbi:MAG: hypothetical protein R3E12_09775 [Candidatus Eisenbacteria bacterium]
MTRIPSFPTCVTTPPPALRSCARIELLIDLALLTVCDDAVLVGSDVYPRGRQTLNPDGDFCRISFWASSDLLEDLDAYFHRIQRRVGALPTWAGFMILVRDAVHAWKNIDPKRKPRWWRIHERDHYRCQPPGCSKRADLHGHHIRMRSHQGSDDPSNLVSTCYGHHQHGIHEGFVECSGNADEGLRWVLGPRARRGRPFRIYQGDLRVDRGTDPAR